MIPLRIELQGFLCHRHKSELSFDDSPLWMLAGLNGSGKSAVFDAVTFALFGGHRGGQRDADQLINTESDGLIVVFDIRLGSETYRLRRTLRRNSRSSRQIFRLEGDPDPVPLTETAKGFDDWVREKIGLNYETFTSSVLLMQGRADKLLGADAKDRRRVLAGVVDLDRYERLHKIADELRKKHKDRAEDMQSRLSVTAEVSDADLTAAEEKITAAATQLNQARDAVGRWQRLEVQAERWADLRSRLVEAKKKWERAQGLLADSAAIERDGARVRELKEVLPHLKTAAEQRQKLDESKRNSVELAKECDALTARLGELTYAEEQTRAKRELAQQTLAVEQQREQELSGRLQSLAGALKQVELFERQQQTATRAEAELAKLTFDPEAFARDRLEADRLAELDRVLSPLARLHRKREELRTHREQARHLAEEEKTLLESGKRLGAQSQTAEAARNKARQERQQAAESAAQAKARRDDARKEVAALGTLSGEKRCRHCGQELTAQHVEEERVRREKVVANAEASFRTADKVHKKATEDETHAEAVLLESQKELLEARDRYKELKGCLTAAESAATRAAAECLDAFDDLPLTERRQVAEAAPDDWLTTTYPRADELEAMRRQVQGWPAIRQRVQDAEAIRQRWTRLQAERDAATASLDAQRAALPSDPDGVRRDHAAVVAEDAELKRSLRERRTQLRDDETTLQRLAGERETVRQRHAERERKLSEETIRQETGRELLARTRSLLPAAWQGEVEELTTSRLARWNVERDTLEKQGAETRAKELEQARQGLEPLRREIAGHEAEIESVPAEARGEPEIARQQLTAARTEQARREEELGSARGERQALLDRRAQRQQLSDDCLKQDQLFNRWRMLAELLGPKRLQLHLVRRAETGIVEHANEVLDRLSSGQLYLKLRTGEGDESAEKALDLEAYVRTAGDRPVGVQFLSGSQRFRVAVSLALGIGRYASNSHRPIESVIIDEGFGCLDRQGRQVMIQELQNLREHLRCILLVSHQEEFADAFATGYRFELTEGGTEVTRFQR